MELVRPYNTLDLRSYGQLSSLFSNVLNIPLKKQKVYILGRFEEKHY